LANVLSPGAGRRAISVEEAYFDAIINEEMPLDEDEGVHFEDDDYSEGTGKKDD